MPSEMNPFESSQVGQASEAEPAKRFRWRIVPVGLLFGLGVVEVGLGVVASVIGIRNWWINENLSESQLHRYLLVGLLSTGIVWCYGGLLMVAAWRFYRGKWKSGIAALATCFFLAWLTSSTGWVASLNGK